MNIKQAITTRQDVCNVQVSKETRTYKPVEHCKLIDVTLEAANKHGFNLRDDKYMIANKGQIATAYYDFDFGGTETGLRVAWQNSYNKSVTLKYAIGQVVFVCTNGGFAGDMGAFKKKHVGNVQTFTPDSIYEYFGNAEEVYRSLELQKELLKEKEMSRKTIASLIGDMYLNESILKSTQTEIIRREIENPSFDYNSPNSAWELYNHITHSLKTVHPSDYIDSHRKVNNYFVDKFGLPLNKVEELEYV